MVKPRWQPARVCTVIGAAHRRQGRPCQDASLAVRLGAADGAALELMAVADGHGGSRYWLSEVGSTLACHQAEAAVAELLACTPLQDRARWEELLRRELPERITARWLEAIAADWRQRGEVGDQPFSPLPYGSTLGLVLMAPGWWGHTGLGDWDLVRLAGGAGAELVSEEPAQLAGGEATASLCLAGAAALFAGRARLHRLEVSQQPLALVLSTDGLRKSCATDDDFLRLCAQVVILSEEGEVRRGLEQVSAQGSGDDLSLAIGRWGMVEAISPQQPCHRPWPWLVAVLLLAGSLGAAAWWLRPRWLPPALAAEVQRLCRRPELIAASLNQRRSQFRQLQKSPQQAVALLAAAPRDPLGAVIAASRRGVLVACPPLQQQLQVQWRHARIDAGRMAADASRSAGPPPLAQDAQPVRR